MRKRWRRRIEALEAPHHHDPYNLAVPFRLPPPPCETVTDRHFTQIAPHIVDGTLQGWVASCACQWETSPLPTEEDAYQAALDHWNEVRPLA